MSVKLKQYGSTRIFQLNRCRGFLLDLQRLLSYRTQSQNTSDYWEKKAAIESVFLLVKVQRIEIRESHDTEINFSLPNEPCTEWLAHSSRLIWLVLYHHVQCYISYLAGEFDL